MKLMTQRKWNVSGYWTKGFDIDFIHIQRFSFGDLRVHQKKLQLLALSAIAPPRIDRPTCLKSHAQHFGIDSSSVLLLVWRWHSLASVAPPGSFFLHHLKQELAPLLHPLFVFVQNRTHHLLYELKKRNVYICNSCLETITIFGRFGTYKGENGRIKWILYHICKNQYR